MWNSTLKKNLMRPCRLDFSRASAQFFFHSCRPRSWIGSQMLQRTMLFTFTKLKLPEKFVITYRKRITVLGIKGVIVATHGSTDCKKIQKVDCRREVQSLLTTHFLVSFLVLQTKPPSVRQVTGQPQFKISPPPDTSGTMLFRSHARVIVLQLKVFTKLFACPKEVLGNFLPPKVLGDRVQREVSGHERRATSKP